MRHLPLVGIICEAAESRIQTKHLKYIQLPGIYSFHIKFINVIIEDPVAFSVLTKFHVLQKLQSLSRVLFVGGFFLFYLLHFFAFPLRPKMLCKHQGNTQDIAFAV